MFLPASSVCQADNLVKISKRSNCVLSYLRNLISNVNCGYEITNAAGRWLTIFSGLLRYKPTFTEETLCVSVRVTERSLLTEVTSWRNVNDVTPLASWPFKSCFNIISEITCGWRVTRRILMQRYQVFGGILCLHLQGKIVLIVKKW